MNNSTSHFGTNEAPITTHALYFQRTDEIIITVHTSWNNMGLYMGNGTAWRKSEDMPIDEINWHIDYP